MHFISETHEGFLVAVKCASCTEKVNTAESTIPDNDALCERPQGPKPVSAQKLRLPVKDQEGWE